MGRHDVDAVEWIGRGGRTFFDLPAGASVRLVEAAGPDRFRLGLAFAEPLRSELELPETVEITLSKADFGKAVFADWQRPQVGLALALRAGGVRTGPVDRLTDARDAQEVAAADAAVAQKAALLEAYQGKLPLAERKVLERAAAACGLEEWVDRLEPFARSCLAFNRSSCPESPHLYVAEDEGLVTYLVLPDLGALELHVHDTEKADDVGHRLVRASHPPSRAGVTLSASGALSLPAYGSPEYDALADGLPDDRYFKLQSALMHHDEPVIVWGGWPDYVSLDLVEEAHRRCFGRVPQASERSEWRALVVHSTDELSWWDWGSLNVLAHGDVSYAFICTS